MTRLRVDPKKSVYPMQSGVQLPRYDSLAEDPDTGGWTRLLCVPAGQARATQHARDFECHTAQEEIFVLSGGIAFGDYYYVAPGTYLNHPPFWLHPADQRFSANEPTLMLIRLSLPIDTFYSPIPEDWDGLERFDRPEYEPRGAGITQLGLSDLEFRPVLRHSEATGELAAVLWQNPADERSTWLLKLPPGWQGNGPSTEATGGSDELFVLEGDLHTVHGEREVDLGVGSYYCYPGAYYDGGSRARSEQGLLAVRWTLPTPGLTLPAISHTGAAG